MENCGKSEEKLNFVFTSYAKKVKSNSEGVKENCTSKILSALTMIVGVCTTDMRLLGWIPYADLCSGKRSLVLESGNHCK